ncbi:MAG: alpha/beta fold hydrolase [Sphingomonadales bacterium]|nr:alpha/beta fold hydrolase [Sphingomonadales bacterium]PIX67327.1 MAG: alpha/beta hydrolase [Sphingomonadales bacterium CG_4_10_14_3_um_filter_58_15]NCO48864.1 alpha/beta fold hydrolase [Sphingomonadales bacterium]NCO99377.1 alpha/beta fold hydrolase [Sphingomonadales bacterium]NCP27002.1 alpha/beta fold hydrolase [Sphingomonadales bacterium]
MSRRYPEWTIEGQDWPNHQASRFVEADRYKWHVQRMGPKKAGAPVCLLLHGTGAATHSWRDIIPLLAKDYDVIALDLPGHGFTRPTISRQVSLPKMAASIGVLLEELEASPALIVGHSAGAAIGLQLMLDKCWKIPLVGLNPALMPFPGLAAKLFPQLAKMLFTNPFVSRIFARWARYPGETEKFLRRSTGSRIDPAGALYYGHLFSRSGHCDGAIRMMANWRLEELQNRLTEIETPVLLVHGQKDNAIPKSAVQGAADLIAQSTIEEVANVGHLAHEEDPEQLAQIILKFAKRHVKL